ncbi:hypothetical protein DFQ26_003242 [Actinomortierella ambigua]|nr:hypothetical protein DFQ26_003242 [Actinomortierella ambigua]
MTDKKDTSEQQKVDLERQTTSSGSSFSEDVSDRRLREIGEQHPFYVHDMTWTEEEEKRLVRTFDLRIMSWIGIMFFFMQLDRGNMSNALTDNIMDDLGVNLNTITLGTTVFVLFFCLFEIPSNMIIRRLGAHRWIPFLMTMWGIATTCQVFMHDRASFLVCRAMVGMFEAGYIPGIAIYLTSYYKRGEMAVRLSIFWGTLAIANSVAGLLAFGVLRMRGLAGLQGWKWLFLIEGVATILVGILSFFVLPEGPTATKGYLRFDGFLTERQEQIAITRLIRDDPSKADPSKKVVGKAEILRAVLSARLWPNLLIGFFGLLPGTGLSTFAPLMIKSFGFGSLVSNVMAIPGHLWGLCTMAFVSWSSDRHKDRALHGFVATLYYAACVLTLALLPHDANKYSLYFAVILAQGGFTIWHPVNAAWIAENVAPVGKRSIALALYIISVNLCDIPGANVFRAEHAPRFIPGMWVLFSVLVITALLFLFQRYHLMWVNKKRDEQTKGWTEADWDHYYVTTTHVGDDRLDFRFTY